MVYLIHFDKPFKHARHYIGYCGKGKLKERMERHRAGNGAKLLRAVMLAGIGFEVVKVWKDGDRDFERKLKRHSHSKEHCKICKLNNMDTLLEVIEHCIANNRKVVFEKKETQLHIIVHNTRNGRYESSMLPPINKDGHFNEENIISCIKIMANKEAEELKKLQKLK